MIAKPTTEQILLDCSRELMEYVLPAVEDDTVKVKVMMLDLVLRNAANRAAHEIAWMLEESEELTGYAQTVLADHPDASDVAGLLDKLVTSPTPSLHLDDVVERYRQASETFSRAMEASVATGDQGLVDRAGVLLERRVERETEIMAGWSPVGR